MSRRIRRIQQLPVPEAPLVGRYGLFHEPLEIHTDDPRVLLAADAAFGRFEAPVGGQPLVIRLVVAGAGRQPLTDDLRGARLETGLDAGRDEARLDARNLVHDTAGTLFAITLGRGNRAVVDLAGGFGAGTLTDELAADPPLLRYAFLEAMAQAMLTGGRGYVPIHASCVVRAGIGVVLQAPAGTGKSTLAMACARRGWGLLAEDVVFARPIDGPVGDGPLELWGMPWTQRLLPDAPRFFPDLEAAPVRLQANGEHKLEVDIDAYAPGAATPRARAGPVVLLARATGGPTRAEWLGENDPDVVEVLWPWEGGWTDAHERTAERLLANGVLRLHLNSTPDEAVDALAVALAGGRIDAASRLPAV